MNIDHHRRRLLALEQHLMVRLGDEVDSVRSGRTDPAEAGMDAGDLALADEREEEYSALAETDAAILTQVRAALGRIDEGTFGTCIVDGEPIEAKRLEALPWTPYCFKHQAELEERLRVRTPSL